MWFECLMISPSLSFHHSCRGFVVLHFMLGTSYAVDSSGSNIEFDLLAEREVRMGWSVCGGCFI